MHSSYRHSATSFPLGARLQPIRFGEFLCEHRMISDEQLLDALGEHWSNGGTIGAAIERRGFLPREEIERQAARFHNLEVVEV